MTILTQHDAVLHLLQEHRPVVVGSDGEVFVLDMMPDEGGREAVVATVRASRCLLHARQDAPREPSTNRRGLRTPVALMARLFPFTVLWVRVTRARFLTGSRRGFGFLSISAVVFALLCAHSRGAVVSLPHLGTTPFRKVKIGSIPLPRPRVMAGSAGHSALASGAATNFTVQGFFHKTQCTTPVAACQEPFLGIIEA